MELRGQPLEDAAERLLVQGRLQLRRVPNTIDAGSIAAGSFTGNPQAAIRTTRALAFSPNSPGHRFFIAGSYSKEYFSFGATTVSAYWEARTIGNASYIFSGDMNGDSASGNDLIYIHRDQSEMNFSAFTASGRTFTAAEQAAAWTPTSPRTRI